MSSVGIYHTISYTITKEPRADVGRYSTREASAQKIFASVRLLGLIVFTVYNCD